MVVCNASELDELLLAELVIPAELDQLKDELASLDRSEDQTLLLDWLVERQYLTAWQAREFVAGRRTFCVGGYVLQEELRGTDMVSVYRCVHARAGWPAVLKILAPEVLENAEVAARFRREIELVAKLNHPHIVTVYGADLDAGSRFLAMEYIDGATLWEWYEHCNPLPIPWLCECCRQAALGLQHAHEQSLVHRDIQPANLMVVSASFGRRPLLKIVDFGIARAMSETWLGRKLTKLGAQLGSPDYVALEQARDPGRADIRADLFSLGCVLYHLLTRRLPFTGATPIEKVLARTGPPPAAPSTYREAIPAELDTIVLKLLSREPDERYAQPCEVAEALEPFTATLLDGERASR